MTAMHTIAAISNTFLYKLPDVPAFTKRVEQVVDNRAPEELAPELESRLKELCG